MSFLQFAINSRKTIWTLEERVLCCPTGWAPCCLPTSVRSYVVLLHRRLYRFVRITFDQVWHGRAAMHLVYAKHNRAVCLAANCNLRHVKVAKMKESKLEVEQPNPSFRQWLSSYFWDSSFGTVQPISLLPAAIASQVNSPGPVCHHHLPVTVIFTWWGHQKYK